MEKLVMLPYKIVWYIDFLVNSDKDQSSLTLSLVNHDNDQSSLTLSLVNHDNDKSSLTLSLVNHHNDQSSLTLSLINQSLLKSENSFKRVWIFGLRPP